MRSLGVLALVLVVAGCGGAKKEPAPLVPAATASSTPNAPAATTAAAAPAKTDEPPPAGSLYARLGGRPVLVKVVDVLVTLIEKNPKLHLRFTSVLTTGRVDTFKANLVDELCVVTGGNCTYRGRSLKDAHRALHVSEAEWNAFMIDFQAALDENQIAQTEQLDFLTLLTPMRAAIIDGTARRR